jgi:cytochrome b involved in lipid metabolism
MSKVFTTADVAKHDQKAKELYIIVDGTVYDVTGFVDEHPGGAKILKRVAGKDASKQFWKVCSMSTHYMDRSSSDRCMRYR